MNSSITNPRNIRHLRLKERRDLITDIYGISPEKIRAILELEPSKQRVLSVAKEAYKGLKSRGFSKAEALFNISASLLESLIVDKEEYLRGVKSANHFIGKFASSNEESPIVLNAPTNLRQIVFNSIEGKDMLCNALKTLEIWPGLSFSDVDLMRGVRIPKTGIEQALLYGIMTRDGRVDLGQAETSKISINYYGDSERLWMVNNLVPILNNTFKIMRGSVLRNGMGYDEHRNRALAIYSKAVTEFAIIYLGMSEKKKDRRLIDISTINPKGDIDVLKRAYFAGLIHRLPIINLRTTCTSRMTLEDNIVMLSQIQELGEELGYFGRLSKDKTRLTYNQTELEKLASDTTLDGLIVNDGIELEHKGLILKPEQYRKLEE